MRKNLDLYFGIQIFMLHIIELKNNKEKYYDK